MAAAAEDGDGDELLAALGEAAGVYNNASGTQTCYELPEDESYAGIWDYQWCPARGLARRCPPLLPAAAGPAVSPPPPQRAPHPLSGSRNIEFRAPRPSGLRRVSVVEQPPAESPPRSRCTEQLPQEAYFPRDGVHDMFFPAAVT